MTSTGWALLGLAVAGWLITTVVLVADAARRRRAWLGMALRLRSELRPYLVAQAEERELSIDESLLSSETITPETIVNDLTQLARRLNAPQTGAIDDSALAVDDTLPIDQSDDRRSS